MTTMRAVGATMTISSVLLGMFGFAIPERADPWIAACVVIQFLIGVGILIGSTGPEKP